MQTFYLSSFSPSGAALTSATIPAPVLSGPFPPEIIVNTFSIDASGNLWIPLGSQLDELIGLAAPVVTPLSAAVAANKIATLP